MAPTTMQPHRQIYNSVIQSYPDAAKFFFKIPKCEQILQNARRSHYSTNLESKSIAAELNNEPNPSLFFSWGG